MADDESPLTRVKGKVTEATGWATGDREVEARGKVEAETGDEPEDATVDEVEDEVREEHGDI